MILFFRTKQNSVIAVDASKELSKENISALEWLFGDASMIDVQTVDNEIFVGPRREMITPWSTTAVEITQNMNIKGIRRIEEFMHSDSDAPAYDKMLQRVYKGLDQEIFKVDAKPAPVRYITDFDEYNKEEGLALNKEEIEYLKSLSEKIGRPLTDSEVFGFSQVNSEHCRHKIFNGVFIIDGKEMESSLFKMIKKTSRENPNLIVSAYKDNCAFIVGPKIGMFHPASGSKPDFFVVKEEETVISLKAETHNFPTTVEPFNGAATGSGGEIRDRIAGGKGSFPIAGTACYITSYPRFDEKIEETPGINKAVTTKDLAAEMAEAKEDSRAEALLTPRNWEHKEPRKWLYQTPQEILTKASNGASDFGNKFGQAVICGSLLTAEADEIKKFGFDKVIMLAGGIGYAKRKDALKETPKVGDKVVLLGGDNYRIGMGGGAVSSVNTGAFSNAIELNAIQRSNPEMQKRVYNAIRAISENDVNTIVSVHDHGAGGHLNCLSELVEETGGTIDISKLPVGDPTLSLKEIIGNESQERMGLVMDEKNVAELKAIADRERAPMYVIGETTGKHNFTLKNEKTGEAAIDLQMTDMFGSAPKTYMKDVTKDYKFEPLSPLPDKFLSYLEQVLQLESVACKDWLTNKVDRSVSGLIAHQQTCGEIQLPINDLGVIALGYDTNNGVATSMGHAPMAALIDSAAGSRLAISEALTNIVWAPLKDGLKGVSLSANWMWPCRNEGEDSRLYRAVKGASDFACELGINIPTGKDSMSMTQKYPNGETVLSPGTLIISTVAPVTDVRKVVTPQIKESQNSVILYMPFTTPVNGLSRVDKFEQATATALGGSALAQVMGKVGNSVPDVTNSTYFAKCFNAVQQLVDKGLVLAGHDISAGGLITTLLEMTFPNVKGGLAINGKILNMYTQVAEAACGTKCFADKGKTAKELIFKMLFSEAPGVVMQVDASKLEEVSDIINVVTSPILAEIEATAPKALLIGTPLPVRKVVVSDFAIKGEDPAGLSLDIDHLRDLWFKTSYLFDIRQVGVKCANDRYINYSKQPLQYKFPAGFVGKLSNIVGENAVAKDAPVAAIIREKGSNGDREMAWALHLAGFRVKDVHMTDLISGRETLKEVKMIVFVGGFSNADTLGSAKGWAGAFLYNPKAKVAIDEFYAREDTLSLGICNGCQLMAELGLITPAERELSPKIIHNDSHKYESAFVGVTVEDSPSVMLNPLVGSKLGIWVAHGEGKFSFPAQNGAPDWSKFKVAVRYNYNTYPGNPNGSPNAIAGVVSADGRHLAMMPHPERCLRPWNWAYYSGDAMDDVTPWVYMFIAARQWCEKFK